MCWFENVFKYSSNNFVQHQLRVVLLFQSHILLLQSKENINPSMPLDEQTDALPYDRKWEFPVQDLTLGMLIGQGAFGKVLKAEARNIEQEKPVSTVAVKTVRGILHCYDLIVLIKNTFAAFKSSDFLIYFLM